MGEERPQEYCSCPLGARDRKEIELLLDAYIDERIGSRDVTYKEIKVLSDAFGKTIEVAQSKHSIECPLRSICEDLTNRILIIEKDIEVREDLKKEEREKASVWGQIVEAKVNIAIAVCAVVAVILSLINVFS